MLSVSLFDAKYSKVPTLISDGATRVKIAPGRGFSRYTVSPVTTEASARVVGILR